MSQPTGPYLRGDLAPLPPGRESEAAVRQVHPMRFAWRNRHATIPLAAPVVMFTAGEILHGVHHPLDVLVVTSAISAVTWFKAPHKWDRPAEVTYGRATTLAAGGWLALAAYAGVSEPMEILLGLGCATWGGIFWWHKRPRDKKARRKHALRVGRWNTWWQSHAPRWGVAGSGILDVKDHGAMEGLLIQLWGGEQTWQTIKNLTPLIESALGGHGPDGSGYVHHGMSRVEVVKSNPSQVWLYLKREDPLKGEIEWEEPQSADICDPADLGTQETGTVLDSVLRSGWLILGRTRSGKSNELSVLLAKMTKCRNSRVLLIDLKGGRSARPWLPAIDWLATTIEEARLILAFAAAEVAARGAYAYNGEEQLTPTDEVPTLFVVIDETYAVTSEAAGDSRCAALLALVASQGQGLEIYPVVLSQYGSLDATVRTEQTRSNLNRRMCFQTEHAEHGKFALGDDLDRRGIDTTKLAQKGTFYFREDSDTSPQQVRGPHMPHKLAREIAERNAERTGLHDRPLMPYCGAQPVSAEPGAPTWQQVYDGRWSRLPAAFRRDAPQADPTPPEDGTMPANKINMRPVHPEAVLINADIDESPDVSDEDILRARQMRADRGEAPIDLGNRVHVGQARFASLLQGAPPRGITPAQLKSGSGLGRTWIHVNLAALCDAGAAEKIADGRYRAVADDILAGLAAIHGEASSLAETARQMAGK